MQLELEPRDDAEVAAASAQAPQQVLVLGLARVHEPAVGRHDVGGDEVVAREAELPHRPADAAAEREAGDAGRRHEPAGGRESVCLRLVVDVGPHRTAADGRAAGDRVDADLVHLREVDHDSVVDRREAGDAVAAAADCDRQVVAAREADGRDHVGDAGAAHDECGTALVCSVPDPRGLLIAGVARRHDLAVDRLAQFLHCCLSERPRTDGGHLVPFVGGQRATLSAVSLHPLSGHFASCARRSSTLATPSASSRAA